MDNNPQPEKHRYFLLNKPYNMVSQFVSTHPVPLLGDVDFDFPIGIHAIGRLDKNSEGLLLLTTNKKITKLLFEGKTPHIRTYYVMVLYTVTAENLQRLKDGITFIIKDGVSYTMKPCDVSIIDEPDINTLSPYILTPQASYTWLSISLTEGKFHQVRKMVQAISHKCKRLIRVSIENITLDNLQPGCVKEISEKEFFSKLNLDLSAKNLSAVAD
jgi:23S rRNA pseudouridine2457 synthase